MVAGGTELELFRAEIVRLLGSPEFASSRQLQDFLRYTSEKAFLGESHLEQSEIALAVLSRGADFNPVEDAAVRKMASQVRQRLEHYYAQPGNSNEVVVTLPVRSYVPKFERRVEPAAPSGSPPSENPRTNAGLAIRFAWGAALLLVIVGLGLLVKYRASPAIAKSAAGSLELWTAKGDITTGGDDAPGNAVRLGPKLRDVDEISARLDFTPNREAQQAGLIVWQDTHHFVRLGRKFFGRNEIEFLLEEGNASFTRPGNTIYDAEGQSGQPLWLSIRRHGNAYSAYLSHDGIRWEAHGETIVPHQPFVSPRAGVYALNGRRDALSIKAVFSNLATGWTFDRSGDLDSVSKGDWMMTNTCPESTTAAIEKPVLRIGFSANPGNCVFDLARPLASGDWEISTLVDSFPLPGQSAGLRIQGTKAVVRLVRYFLNGPAISFINDGKTLVGKPDLNGSPAIILRIAARKGNILANYSADGTNFESLPVNLKLEDLGGNLRGGIRFGTTTTNRDESSSIARFYYYRESVENLVPYR